MLVDENYKDVVTKTFVNRAIRSALLIDDQFPRFDEVLEMQGDVSKKYKEADRAGRLYKMFRDRHILCDVENKVKNIEDSGIIERIRKSDFILLDYHLTADESETSHSISLLQKLSRSHHFNIVVLYTKHPDLRDVWLNIAVNLKGGWQMPSNVLGDELIEKWDDLEGENQLPFVDEAILVECLNKKEKTILRSSLVKPLRDNFVALNVAQKDATKFIIASIHQLARMRLVEGSEPADTEYALVGSCEDDGPFWIQSGNTFVAIVKKPVEADVPEETSEESPEATREGSEIIFEKLSEALVAWRPNIVQILLSEIQNVLELDGLATDEDYTGTPKRQTGIGYRLLSLMPAKYVVGEMTGIDSAIISTVEKITESIRNRVSVDARLLEITRKLVEPLVASPEWEDLPTDRKERVASLANFTKSALQQNSNLENEDIFVDLNTFLSTERFGGISVTTGTVFSDSEQNSWWLCCSPPCDMAPRPPSSEQKWLTSISPAKSMIALQLEPIASKNRALKNAEHGVSVFIRCPDGEYQHFNAVPANGQPVWEVMLVADYGKVTEMDDEYCFKGQRIQGQAVDGGDELVISELVEFTVAAQLRPEYAARLLQMTGQHLSRIGVDFVNLP